MKIVSVLYVDAIAPTRLEKLSVIVLTINFNDASGLTCENNTCEQVPAVGTFWVYKTGIGTADNIKQVVYGATHNAALRGFNQPLANICIKG